MTKKTCEPSFTRPEDWLFRAPDMRGLSGTLLSLFLASFTALFCSHYPLTSLDATRDFFSPIQKAFWERSSIKGSTYEAHFSLSLCVCKHSSQEIHCVHACTISVCVNCLKNGCSGPFNGDKPLWLSAFIWLVCLDLWKQENASKGPDFTEITAIRK